MLPGVGVLTSLSLMLLLSEMHAIKNLLTAIWVSMSPREGHRWPISTTTLANDQIFASDIPVQTLVTSTGKGGWQSWGR